MVTSGKGRTIEASKGDAYYLLPLSMVVVCVMIAARETQNNGILKMLALPINRKQLSLAKFLVLAFYLLMEMAVFLVVFVVAGLIATSTMGVTETLPFFYLLKWCGGLFLTMLPCLAVMWAITVFFEKNAAFRWPESSAHHWRYLGCQYTGLDPVSLLLQWVSGILFPT